MNTSYINSDNISQIKDFIDLKSFSSNQSNKNRFIAEGPEVVLRHLESFHNIESLLIDETHYSILKELIEKRYEISPFNLYLTPKDLISETVGFKIHQGIVSLGLKPTPKDITLGDFPLVALNGLANAENVGAIIRTAQAFGISNFLVDERTSDPWIRRSVRVSMGTIFSSNVFYCKDLVSSIAQLGITKPDLNVIGLEQAENSVSVYSGEFDKKFDILVLGSEKAGTEKGVLDLCTKIVEIPVDRSSLNSLNVNAALSAFMAVCASS